MLRTTDTFFLGTGSLIQARQKTKLKHAKSDKTPWRPGLSWLLDQHDESREMDSFDTGRIPNVVTHLSG